MISYPLAVGPSITRVIESGTTGPVVILLHGLTSRADRWRHNIDALAGAGYHLYAPDLPGHGFASKTAEFDHSIPGYREFLLQFLDRIGADRATLVGTSLGGHVVAAAAIAEPSRVERLVVIGSLGLQPVTEEKIARTTAGLNDMRLDAMRLRLLQVFTDPRHVTEDLVLEDVRINTSPGAKESFDRFLRYFATAFNRDLVLDGLARLSQRLPTLLLWGEDDKSVPVAIPRSCRHELPSAKFAVFERTNHTPYWEYPAVFNDLLLRFLHDRLPEEADSEWRIRPGVTA
jgi:pimeloyl-ACP methyl ester carboxylesterase